MIGVITAWRDLYRGAIDWYQWLEDELTEWLVGEGPWMRADEGKCTAGADRTHHPINPHQAVNKQGQPISGHLCERHFTDLAKMLHQVEQEAADLDISPSMALSFEHGGGTLASQQTPVRLDPLVLRDPRHGRGDHEGEEEARAGATLSLLNILGRYAVQVRHARGITLPLTRWVERIPGTTQYGPVCAEPCTHQSCAEMAWVRSRPTIPTVQSERQVLSRQLDWIATQNWAGTFFDDIHKLLGQLQRANGTSAPKPMPGRCPTLVGEKQTRECGGPLWPAKPQATSESDKWQGSSPSVIQCGSCNSRWEGAGPLARLAIILDQQKKAKGA